MPLVRNDLQVPLWQLQAMPRLQDMSVFQLRPVTPSYAALLHNPPKLRCMAKINGTSNQIVLNKYTDGQVHNKYRYTRKASVSAPDQKLCNVFRVQNGKQSILEKAEENLDGYEKLGYKDIAENRTPVASLGFSNQSKATQEQNLIDQNGNIITDNLTDSRNVQTQKWVFGNMGCESDVLSNGNTNKCTSKSTSGGQYTSLLDINANRTAVSNTGSIQEWDHSVGQKKCSSESNGTKNHQRHIGILNVPPIFIGNTSNSIGKDTEKMSNCINNGERTNLLASQEDSRQSLTVKAENMSSEDQAVQRDHVLLGSVQEEGFCRCKDQTDFLVISKGHYPSRCLSCKGLTPCKCEKKKLSKSLNPDTDDQRSHLPRNNKYFLCETCGLLMHIANAQSVPDKEVKTPDCVERYPRKSDINVHHTFEEMPVSSKPFQENDHTFSEPSRLHAEPKVPETQILHSRSFSLKPLTGSKQYTSSRLDNGTLPIPEGRTNFFVLKSPEVKSTKYKLTTADAKSTPYKVLSSDEKETAYVLKLSDGKTASYRLLLPDKKSTSFELLPPSRKIISSCQPTTPDEKCTTFVVKFSDGKSTYAQLLTPGDKGTNFVLKLSDGKSIRYHLLKPDVGDEKGTSFVLLPLFERCTYYKLPSVHRKCTSSKTPTLHKGKPASPKQQKCDAKISILNLRRVNGKHTDSKMKSTDIDNEKSTSPKAQKLEDSLSSPSQLELLNTEKDKCEYSSKTEFIKMHHLYIDFPEENLEETRFFQGSGRKEKTDEGDGMVANSGQTGYRKHDQISAHLNNNLEQPLIGLLSSLTEEKDCAGDSLTNSASDSPPRHSVHDEQDKYALLSPDSEESDTESPLGKTQRCDKICARKGQLSVKQTGKGIRTKKGSKISGSTDLYSVTQLNRKKGTVRQCGRIDKEKGRDLPPVLDIHLSRKQRSRDKASRIRSFTTNQKQNQPPSDNIAKLRKTVTKTGTTGDGSFLYGTTGDGTFLSGITDDGIFLSGTTGVGSFLSGSNKLQKKNGRSSTCFSTKTDGCHSGRSVLGFSSSTPSMFGLCKFTRLGKDTLCDVSHSVLDRNSNNRVLEIVPKSNNHCRIQKEKQFSQRRLAGNKSDSETSMAMESRESAPEPNRIVQEVKRCDPGSSIFVEPRLSDPGQNKATELMSDPAPIKDADYSRGLNNGQSIVRKLKGSDSGKCKGGENKVVPEMKEFHLGSSITQESRGSLPEPSIFAESRESNHGSVISKESRGSKTGPDILRDPSSDSGKILTREIKSSDQGPSIVKEPKGSDSGPSIVRGSGESDTAPSLNREIQQSDAGSNMATESTGSCLGEVPGGAGSGPRIVGGFERSNPDQDIHHRGYMDETMPLSQQAKSLRDEGIEDSIKFRTLYPHMYSVLMDQGLKDTLQDSPNPHAEISSTSQDLCQVNDSSYVNCNTDTSVMNEMYAPMDVCTKRNIHPPHHNNSVKNKLSASNNKRIYSVDFFSNIILQDKRVLKAQVQKLCKTISYLDDVLLRKYRQDLLDVTSLHTCRGLYHYKRAPKFSYIGQKIIHPKRRIIRILKKKLRPALIHKLKERIQTHKREGIKQKNQILSTFSSVNGKEQQAKKRVKSSFGLVNMVQRRIKAQKKQRTPRQKCTSFMPQNTASQVKTSDMELTEKVTECQSTYLLDKTSVNEEVEQQSSASKRLEVKEHATGARRSEVKGQETFSVEGDVLHSNIRAVDGLERTQNGRLRTTNEDEKDVEFGKEMASDDQQHNNCSGLFHNKLLDSSTQVVNSVISSTNDKDYQMLTQADQMVGDLQDKSNELSIKECFCHMPVDIAQDLATTDWFHNEKSLSVLNPSLHYTQSSNNLSAVMASGVFDNNSHRGASFSQICLEQRKYSNDIHPVYEPVYEPGIQENNISSHWNSMLVNNKGSTAYWGCGPPSGQKNMVCPPHTKSNVVNCSSNMIKKQGIGFTADTRKPYSSFMQQMLELVDNVMGKNIYGSKTSAMCDQDMTVSSSCETVDNISNVAEVVAPLTVDKAPADHVFSYSDISEDDIGLCGEVENSGSDPEDLEYMEDLQYGQQL